MLILSLEENVALTLEIADAEGCLREYKLTPQPPGLDRLCFTLLRADTQALYHVLLSAHGFWRCTCPQWKYRKQQADDCKHTRALRTLADFARMFTAETP